MSSNLDKVVHLLAMLAGLAAIAYVPGASTAGMVVLMVGATGLVTKQVLDGLLSAAKQVGVPLGVSSSANSSGTSAPSSSGSASPGSPGTGSPFSPNTPAAG